MLPSKDGLGLLPGYAALQMCAGSATSYDIRYLFSASGRFYKYFSVDLNLITERPLICISSFTHICPFVVAYTENAFLTTSDCFAAMP